MDPQVVHSIQIWSEFPREGIDLHSSPSLALPPPTPLLPSPTPPLSHLSPPATVRWAGEGGERGMAEGRGRKEEGEKEKGGKSSSSFTELLEGTAGEKKEEQE